MIVSLRTLVTWAFTIASSQLLTITPVYAQQGVSTGQKIQVAIVPFKGTDEKATLDIANGIAGKLDDRFRVCGVSEVQLGQMRSTRTYSGDTTDLSSPVFARTAGTFVNAAYAICGSYTKMWESCEIFGVIIDVNSGRSIGMAHVNGKFWDQTVDTFAGKIYSQLGASVGAENRSVEAQNSTNPEDSGRLEAGRVRVALDEQDMDFGWSSFFASPIYKVILWLDSYFNDLGFTLIFFGVILSMVYSVITFDYRQRLLRFSGLAKFATRLYEDDLEGQQKALLQLSQDEKLNPYGMGCLISSISIFILVIFNYVISVPDIFKHVESILWLTDFSKRDPFHILPLIGGFVTYNQVMMQSEGLRHGMRIGQAIFRSAFMALLLYFLPAGVAVVYAAFTFFSNFTFAYERKLENKTRFKALVPGVVFVGLLVFVGRSYVYSTNPVSVSTSEVQQLPAKSSSTGSMAAENETPQLLITPGHEVATNEMSPAQLAAPAPELDKTGRTDEEPSTTKKEEELLGEGKGNLKKVAAGVVVVGCLFFLMYSMWKGKKD